MKIWKNIGMASMALIATAAVVCMFPAGAHAYLTAKANHDHISVDFFYHGSTVSVRGEADQGADLIVKIASPEGHQALKEKGKVGGVMWMNVGDLKIENVPNLYIVESTKKFDEIVSAPELKDNVIGYPALKDHASMTPASTDADKTKWFDEFVKFKEANKLYSSEAGRVAAVNNGNGRQSYYVLCQWPYQAPPGNYTVTVYAVKDGKVVEKAEDKVVVEQVGVVKRLAEMAKNNAAAYGVISIMAAIGAGFGVGIIFGKGGGAH